MVDINDIYQNYMEISPKNQDTKERNIKALLFLREPLDIIDEFN
jgi:hypothetical protein